MILLSYYCDLSQQRCFLPGRSNRAHRYCGVSEQGSLTTFNAPMHWDTQEELSGSETRST